MRLAWFRARAPRDRDPLDDIAALVRELRASHDIHIFTPETAREFSPAHALSPFDLAVSELADAATASLSALTLPIERILVVRSLAENSLADLITGSRLAVVPYRGVADDLRARFPGTDIRVAVTGVSPVVDAEVVEREIGERPEQRVVIHACPPARAGVVQRALVREGLEAQTVVDTGRHEEKVLLTADIVVSVAWPWAGEPATETLVAMAAARPVVTLETVGTAEWPALDPQSWRPRGTGTDHPIVVSIDPLDEEHSLGLALARLSKDAALRARLGTAARSWWETHATPAHAAAAWNEILSGLARPTIRGSSPTSPTDSPAP
jgi:hypothetical protein